MSSSRAAETCESNSRPNGCVGCRSASETSTVPERSGLGRRTDLEPSGSDVGLATEGVTDLGQPSLGSPLHHARGLAPNVTVLAERSGRRAMTRNPEFGNVTGTKDKDY